MNEEYYMKVFLSAGHSDTDSGAVNGIYREEELCTWFRNAVAYYCRQAGLEVITDGSGQLNKPLNQAVKLIKGTDLAIEFHLNAHSNKTAKGIEALAATKHKRISQLLCKAVHSETGFPLRGSNGGWKPENAGQHSRLAFVSNGGIILELFFISNDAELKFFLANYWIIAKAVAEAIIQESKSS